MRDNEIEKGVGMYDAIVDVIKEIIARTIEITRDAVRYTRRAIESICVNLDELGHAREFSGLP